jgi:hypothetical protein
LESIRWGLPGQSQVAKMITKGLQAYRPNALDQIEANPVTFIIHFSFTSRILHHSMNLPLAKC